MLKIVSEQFSETLSIAISKGDFEYAKSIIENNEIDVDSFIDGNNFTPILMQVLVSNISNENKEGLEMLRYLLQKGANVNKYCKEGYNCLHIAAQQQKLIQVLDLFLNFHGDVNLTDSNGASVVYWAIQKFPWRTEGDERQLHLNLVEKILMLGADLDIKNRHGASPRTWVGHSTDDIKNLVEKCEKLNPIYKPSGVLPEAFPTNLQHPEIAAKIWKELVPPSGQSNTVQGELIRAIEKLRDEARRNGNSNYSKGHKQMAQFVVKTLINSKLFDAEIGAKIKLEGSKLMKSSWPCIDEDVYDFLTDQSCIFYLKTELIQHTPNPELGY